jgi:hypothetical protein
MDDIQVDYNIQVHTRDNQAARSVLCIRIRPFRQHICPNENMDHKRMPDTHWYRSIGCRTVDKNHPHSDYN